VSEKHHLSQTAQTLPDQKVLLRVNVAEKSEAGIVEYRLQRVKKQSVAVTSIGFGLLAIVSMKE
jgi:hypothetical protein